MWTLVKIVSLRPLEENTQPRFYVEILKNIHNYFHSSTFSGSLMQWNVSEQRYIFGKHIQIFWHYRSWLFGWKSITFVLLLFVPNIDSKWSFKLSQCRSSSQWLESVFLCRYTHAKTFMFSPANYTLLYKSMGFNYMYLLIYRAIIFFTYFAVTNLHLIK